MRSDPRRLVLLVATAAALVSACGERPPLRIGVITDCTGIYRPYNDAELSGALLPLIERGAELRGRRASDGVGTVEVAERRVEVVRGCTEFGELSTLPASCAGSPRTSTST